MKTARTALPRASARVGIVHVEYARIAKRQHAVVVRTKEEERVLPLAHLTAVLAGPGTTLTRDAAGLLADAGVTILWVGSGGVRSYGSVTPLATKSTLLLHQVATWADDERRAAAARRLYQMRFPDQDVTGLSISQLRASEGTRVRAAYREIAAEHGLTWHTRTARWQEGDSLNRALTEATQCLYGVTTAAIQSLGCSPALGIIHTGHALSFSFDLADLFKTQIALPLACRLVAEDQFHGPVGSRLVREQMNRVFREERVMARSVEAIYHALGTGTPEFTLWEKEDLRLWSENEVVPSGPNYGQEW